MSYQRENDNGITDEGISKIRAVMTRLYDGATLDYDKRRDLAKILDGVLRLEIFTLTVQS